jgi:hypothetical protein
VSETTARPARSCCDLDNGAIGRINNWTVDELERMYENEVATHGSGDEIKGTQYLVRREIRTAPLVFQPRRSENELERKRHVAELRKALGRKRRLAPIVVFQIAGMPLVVDGHCRLDAYGDNPGRKIPVKYFQGTLKEALRYSLEANSEDKLPLTAS